MFGRHNKELKDIVNPKAAAKSQRNPLISKHVHHQANCPHVLPLFGDEVLGAPLINPELGQVVFDPKNRHDRYLRYIWRYLDQFLNELFQDHLISCSQMHHLPRFYWQ